MVVSTSLTVVSTTGKAVVASVLGWLLSDVVGRSVAGFVLVSSDFGVVESTTGSVFTTFDFGVVVNVSISVGVFMTGVVDMTDSRVVASLARAVTANKAVNATKNEDFILRVGFWNRN